MAKAKIQYACTACGASHTKWAGQCGDCGEWNTMSETIAAITTNNRQGFAGKKGNAQIQALKDIQMQAEMRTPTNISELDRVLGGGLVHGSVTLIGGDPGIGKSTLLTQTLASLSQSLPCLYVTGEESLQQISMRAHRLGLVDRGLRL